MEKLKKQYGFKVVEENGAAYRCIIGGICHTPSCENTYRKQFRHINTSGPYCDECAGITKYRGPHKKRGLLIDEFPEIADSIISNIDLTKITSGTNLRVYFQCPESCSRCKKKHVWNAMLSNRIKGCGCPICHNSVNCPCINADVEFCCYKCRKVKPFDEKCVSYKLCKSCRNKEYNGYVGDVKRYLKVLYRSTMEYIRRRSRKKGYLTLKYLEELYNKQKGKCYISGIQMNAGTHQNWRISIERLDESIGIMGC